jgi:phosphate-selective porin
MTPRSLGTAIAVLAMLALPASAQTPAAAGAPATQAFVVPQHNCLGPKYPSKETTMQLRGDAYNRAIEGFNRDYKAYGECVKKYVDDVKIWQKELADAGNKAIDEYNKYTAEIKEKIEAEKQ